MPIERVIKSVLFDDLVVGCSAWRYICDSCGYRECFPDVPMPEGRSEMDASRRGWRLSYIDEGCTCPECVARDAYRSTQSGTVKEDGDG